MSTMKPRSPIASADPRTRRALLEHLKWSGPLDAAALAGRLGVSAMAVRQHLYALATESLVTSEEQARPVGRPAKLWSLTPAANELFPNAHAELTLSLIGSVRSTFGERGIERLIAARSREQIAAYRARIPSRARLGRRLEILAKLRSEEGYMAEARREADGTWLLIENHCPICAAATACTRLCAGELSVFQSVLGRDMRVERIDHILAGARRCAYRVTPRRAASASRSGSGGRAGTAERE